MLKSIIISALFATSVASQASQMKCKAGITAISETGYLMPIESLSLQAEIQNAGSFDEKKCNRYSLAPSESVLFCAHKTEALGVFSAEALALQNEMSMSTSTLLAGTSESNKSELVELNSTSAIFNSFKQKMTRRGLKSPETFTGDSLQLDDVILKANKKSKKSLAGTPVTMSIFDCEVLK